MDTNSLIIEYSNQPANKYILENPTIRYREHNRVCADVVEVFLLIQDEVIIEASFDGYMSIVATACTAITLEASIGLSLNEILTYNEAYVQSLIGTDISPRRRNASLIGLLAIKNAIHQYRDDGIQEDFSDIFID